MNILKFTFTINYLLFKFTHQSDSLYLVIHCGNNSSCFNNFVNFSSQFQKFSKRAWTLNDKINFYYVHIILPSGWNCFCIGLKAWWIIFFTIPKWCPFEYKFVKTLQKKAWVNESIWWKFCGRWSIISILLDYIAFCCWWMLIEKPW